MDEIHTCAGVIELDEEGRLVARVFNDQFCRMIDLDPRNHVSDKIILDELSRTSVLSYLNEKLRRCFTGGSLQDSEQTYTHHKEDGAWQLMLATIWSRNTSAAPSHVVLTGFEIGKKQNLEEEADDSRSTRYRAIVDLAYDAIITMDWNRQVTLFNQAAENLFGYSSAEVIGKPVEILLPEALRATHPRRVYEFSESYQPKHRRATAPRMDKTNSVFGRRRDGSLIPVEVAVSKIVVNGKPEFIGIVRDVSDRVRLIELLKKEAMTDMLTGLPNRRRFMNFLEKEFQRGGTLSVFILDLDLFKAINDQHGHDIGDDVLRLIATIGENLLNGRSLFARWGGEEFVAALPAVGADEAYEISETIRRHCERQSLDDARVPGSITFTVSIGTATRSPNDRDVNELLKRADRALYRAKRTGRNRVEAGEGLDQA